MRSLYKRNDSNLLFHDLVVRPLSSSKPTGHGLIRASDTSFLHYQQGVELLALVLARSTESWTIVSTLDDDPRRGIEITWLQMCSVRENCGNCTKVAVKLL
jgi:hypothetical protein